MKIIVEVILRPVTDEFGKVRNSYKRLLADSLSVVGECHPVFKNASAGRLSSFLYHDSTLALVQGIVRNVCHSLQFV